jgi:hypothetical protein
MNEKQKAVTDEGNAPRDHMEGCPQNYDYRNDCACPVTGEGAAPRGIERTPEDIQQTREFLRRNASRVYPKIVLTFPSPIHGFWDGGAKSRFTFTAKECQDARGKFLKWGSWEMNFWRTTDGIGKSPKQATAAMVRWMHKHISGLSYLSGAKHEGYTIEEV